MRAIKIGVLGIFSFVLLSFAWMSAGFAAAATYPSYGEIRARMAEFIESEMQRTGTVGLSVAVVDDQRVVWAEGFGWADKARRIAAEPETVYQLASITKLFTAFSAMRLAEENRLDIDAPVQEYLPGFSIKTRFPDGAPIRARHLLTHHSGMPSDFFDIDLSRPFHQVTAAMRDQYACFPPGYVFSYSNPGYIVLGDAVATVSGRPYHQFVRETLIAPLKMDSTFFEPETEKTRPFAKSYVKGREQPLLPLNGVLPAAGMYGSALDLTAFAKMVFADGYVDGRQLFRPETIQEMFRPQNEGIPMDGSYRVGLGWMLSESWITGAGPAAGHEGHFNSYSTKLLLLPEHKLGVIVLANSAEAGYLVGTIADEILRAVLAEKKAVYPGFGIIRTPAAKTSVPQETLDKLAGYYSTHMGVIQVTPKKNKLLARTPEAKLELIPLDNGFFSVKYSLLGLFPIYFNDIYFSFEQIDGRSLVAMHNNLGTSIIGERAAASAFAEAWRETAGTYQLTADGSRFTLLPKTIQCRVENGMILFEMANPMKDLTGLKTWGFIVKPLSASEGVVVGVGRWKGDTVRWETIDGVPHYHFAGLTYRKVGAAK